MTKNSKRIGTESSECSRDGSEWYAQDEIWKIRSTSTVHYLSFRKMSQLVSHEVLSSAKDVFANYLKTHSSAHAKNMHGRLCAFLVAVKPENGVIDEITAEHVLRYRMSLNKRNEYFLGTLRAFFDAWLTLGLPGIATTALESLKEMRLAGNVKGEAVMTADPEKGPFTDTELQAILHAVNKGYCDGNIGLEDYLLILIFVSTGARPSQIAALKFCDLKAVRASDGFTTYILNMPRAKQRGIRPRSEYKVRHLVSDVGALIERFQETLPNIWPVLPLEPGNMPIFASPNATTTLRGLEYHCTGSDLRDRMKALFSRIQVFSERTGKRINITPRRFRYTVGTRAAAEGASELVIAELLDHSDTQNVGVYIEAVPEIVERIDRAMAIHLAPLAQAFAGQLIENEDEAVRGGDPRSRVVSPSSLDNPVGNCGSHGYCGAAAPIACYTCQNFQPWLDGPHEEVLTSLIAERDRVLEQTGDLAIAAINDRLIFAVAQVVDLCEGRKQA